MSAKNGRKSVPKVPSRTFAEASKHIQENLKRHLDRIPSHADGGGDSSQDSSDEDAANGTGGPKQSESYLLESVFASYEGVQNQRTSEAIVQSVTGAAPCIICLSGLKRNSAVWSCQSCYSTFHLNCIQQWANDCIFQKKNQLEDLTSGAVAELTWACPKCRHESKDHPRKYVCYCGKVQDPPFDPWILPHSCGEVCKRKLSPKCGHQCLILCHPGPCPPCPKMVKHDCYCRKSAPAIRRCYDKDWSCGKLCGRRLNCGQHTCPIPCHAGECPPCDKTSVQLCQCKRQKMERECASPVWQCKQKCGKPLGCNHHVCDEVCHSGKCPPCPLSQLRSCPCGKTQHQLPCYEATPLCGNTCGKRLECGQHFCAERCHRGKCGTCLQMVTKSCRCGAKKKEVSCAKKEFTCETKCKRLKLCGKHPCNKKCCDVATCPPQCELPCGKTLSCKNHKCPSRCHGGQCQPCNQTKEVTCNCGKSRYLVPCGMEKSTKPPKCKAKCEAPPECHHENRIPHNCHFGPCPPCKQVCDKPLSGCGHRCPVACHDNVEVKVEVEGSMKAATPWEAVHTGTVGGVRREVKATECPPCQVPVSVTCLGGHETSDWPCHMAKPSSCHRPCGRSLPCGNHTCTRSCHKVKNAPGEVNAGTNCRKCEAGCEKPRPDGCTHPCPRACHPGPCEPCSQTIRIRCHCGLSQLYVKCGEWTAAAGTDSEEELGCCKDQCPKILECGHRCFKTCHRGECGDRKLCKKKVKVYCSCKRVKQDVQCNKAADFVVSCKSDCEEAKKAAELEKASKNLVPEPIAAPPCDSSEVVGKKGKRNRNRRRFEEEEVLEETFFSRNKTTILVVVVVLIPILTAYYLCT